MKILDKILHRRLDRIRNELNSYIAKKIEDNLCEASVPIVEPIIRHESVSGNIGKFFESIRPEHNDENDFEFANEEYYDDDEKGPIQVVPKQLTYTQMQPMYSPKPVAITIPSYLRSEYQTRSIDEVLDSKAETFSSMLLRLIDEKGLKDSDVYKRANIDRRLFSKIRGDEDYVPSKKTAISFCLALQLEIEETKKLLEAAGYALSTASRFDLIIMYLIENEEYNIHFANIVLEDYGEGTLSK